jgi:Zn-dependent M16 (insulinase) family peptidase
MIAKISSVQLSQLKPIVEKYFKPIFFEEYVCSVVCQSDKVSAVTEGFAK